MTLLKTKQAVKEFSQLSIDADLKYHINMYLDTAPNEWDFLRLIKEQHNVTKEDLIALEKSLEYDETYA
tara:strand:+ start:173 stop:379 length:207 start_codon:yes stop_codon:yes gene_type:complete